MIEQLSNFLTVAGDWLYAAFVAPGAFLMWTFVETAPATARRFGLPADSGDNAALIVISAIAWAMLLLLLIIAWRIIRNWIRLAGAWIRTGLYRITTAVSGYKTRVVLGLRALMPFRQGRVANVSSAVEFDDLDLAVLRSVSAEGPGFTLSAPELAERMSLLPAQIQRSLEKLNHNKMISSVIGSTDGFDNYRLSETGAAFVLMWQRQKARG